MPTAYSAILLASQQTPLELEVVPLVVIEHPMKPSLVNQHRAPALTLRSGTAAQASHQQQGPLKGAWNYDLKQRTAHHDILVPGLVPRTGARLRLSGLQALR